jgi:hypothetical protein
MDAARQGLSTLAAPVHRLCAGRAVVTSRRPGGDEDGHAGAILGRQRGADGVVATLVEFIRDCAVLAGAVGVAWWCWEQFRSGAARRDEAARSMIAAERQAADFKQWAALIDLRTAAMTDRLDEMAVAAREAESRMVAKVRVHRLLQSTSDPFLTFAEIENAMAQLDDIVEAAKDATAIEEGTPGRRVLPAGNELRRVLIELVGDGVIAQLDRDRYFIASDYEAGDGDVTAAEE